MRLLIVEDDSELANNLRLLLKREKYSCDVALNFAEAWEKGLDEDYDLMILDWMLPDGEGTELCKKFRSEGVACPILILTAKNMPDDIADGLDSGADDYLAKPFAVKVLLARIKALLRRKEKLVENIMRVGDLEISFDNRTVARGGKKILLTPKEFGVLEYLARNKERIVERGEILSHVWDENYDSFSNTVDVHIRYLRQKIDKNSKRKLIRTVRGKGYQLCD